MAAAAISSSTIDLRSQATYPLRLGASIAKAPDSKRYASVRYNHKPTSIVSSDVKSTIKPSEEADATLLILQDGDKDYTYSGRRSNVADDYVLVSTASGKNKEVVLERLEACHEFNLIEAPSETDRGKLASRYPQLPISADREKQNREVSIVDQPADASNPFDYRHYLKAQKKRNSDRGADTPLSRAETPRGQPSQARAVSGTLNSRPVKQSDNPLVNQKKRKTQESNNTNPKRVKAGTEPPTTSVSGKSRQNVDVPRVRVERKATLRRSSLDDSGELILENETPVNEKPPRQPNAMALALSGQLLGQGPISLRSAASSPASRVASPTPSRPEGMEEGEEFELGESSPEASNAGKLQRHAADEGGDAEEDDEDADADVEDLELPSPVQAHHKNISNVEPTTEGGDDDDDLDKQLALAMAEDDDGGPPPTKQAEVDEESEEE